MKKLPVFMLCLFQVVLFVGPLSAREGARLPKKPFRVMSGRWPQELTEPALRTLSESAAVDTYCIISYDFEPASWQGWTKLDRTAQFDTFFHVDDFNGLGGGSFGRLIPLEGTKSMWCGIRPSPGDPYLCGFQSAPGYGNDWEQILVTDPISFAGTITFSYHIAWDSELDWDFTYVEYDAGGGHWQELASYTDIGSATESHSLILTQAKTKFRFRFVSDFAWSDRDGYNNSDGACIVDELRVSDLGGLNVFQNFESIPLNALNAGIWHARVGTPYGLHSGLRSGLVDKDPCNDHFTSQVVFFIGSAYPSASYPGLYDTPYCVGAGNINPPCQSELVVSPVIDMKKYSTAPNNLQNGTIPTGELPLLAGCTLAFTSYRDLGFTNLCYIRAFVRGVDETGCVREWQNRWVWYLSTIPMYVFTRLDMSGEIGGESRVQIGLGIEDMCAAWRNETGSDCGQHTPSPWFDTVRLYRYKSLGPQMDYQPFHDNFPTDEFNLESFVRCDVNVDLNDPGNPVIRFLDYAWVAANSPLGGGIATDPLVGGPAVYLHVRATYIGPAPTKPNLHGPALAGTAEYPTDPPTYINSRYISDDGVWTIIQCDSVGTDFYIVDLNDSLFTRGYRIDYYFTARDNAGVEAAIPKYARSGPPYLEMTCLPTLNSNVLYVNDDWAEEYWQPVFNAVLPSPSKKVDVYHCYTHGTTGFFSPSARAKNYQLTSAYDIIVWAGWFTDGTEQVWGSAKEDDCRMLIDWMNLSDHPCALWVQCDAAAYNLDAASSQSGLELLATWCGVDVVANSYYQLTGGFRAGGNVSPLVTGNADAGIFVHSGVPDMFYVQGGCPGMNDFDVLEKTGTAKRALSYPSYMGTNYYAAISHELMNAGSYAVRTMWFGFDYPNVRDDVVSAPIDRFEIAKDVFSWFQVPTNVGVSPAEVPLAYKLGQNFPNPFNPRTVIGFDVREKSVVTIKIYSVAGRLVRTLIDGVKEAGSYSVAWDGRSNRGTAVGSGVYFYKMETKGFSETKKLVLLR
jgi:hypothetical protein